MAVAISYDPAMRVALVLLALVPALARGEEPPPYRTHPECAARLATVKSVGVTAPVTKLFELTAGNSRVFRQDWSDRAAENIAAALEASLQARGLSTRRLAAPDAAGAAPAAAPAASTELTEVTQLFDAVSDAILQATYANRFPEKVARFEYSVGDVEKLLAAEGVDALVFAYAFGNISSGGRKAIQALSAVLGGGVTYGIDRLFLAVVDRTGTVVWFDTHGSSGHDLRDPGSAAQFVQALTAELPGAAR